MKDKIFEGYISFFNEEKSIGRITPRSDSLSSLSLFFHLDEFKEHVKDHVRAGRSVTFSIRLIKNKIVDEDSEEWFLKIKATNCSLDYNTDDLLTESQLVGHIERLALLKQDQEG